MPDHPNIPGADTLVDWFGYWPTFHDAELLSITLNRSGSSCVQIHAFETTRETDPQGYFIRAKHAIVTFTFDEFPWDKEGITHTFIDYFNHQNVLSYANIEKTPAGYVLELNGIFGVYASITCKQIAVALKPATSSGEPLRPVRVG